EMMIGGERRYFNRIVSPVRGRFSGSTQSLTVLLQDVTDRVLDRREIEVLAQVMEERSARLDSILSSMTDALWVYDASAQLVDVNQAALLMFGIGSRREALAFGAVDGLALRHADGRPIPRPDHPLMRALQGERIPDFVAVGRHPITSRSMDLSIAAAPIRSGGEVVGAVVVMRDITALLELDRKKDEFLSVASHELRTPLTTIKGYSQLLRHGATTLSPKEQHEFLDSVLSEIDRMMGLISELLDVSRIETKRLELQRESIGWIAFLRARVATFQMQVPDRPITLRTAIEERHLKVDPQRMRQVIDNLLSNALKYSDDDAAVEIVVEERPGTIATSVVDHGIGIPEKELPKLFERFHRASNVSSRYYGGLGLGLYISKAIVEAHGGVLSVRSEEMAGSTFTFALPES
ncbi:MAG TPA: ATP-binding protein, partial [Thermoanaerobaculia bacterium]|nr:ATP-binding protein [Thermoanaerobaculia bacterium]